MRVIGSALLALVGLGHIVCKSAHAQQRFALLIANQGYNVKVGPLKNPHNDVVLVGAALRSFGFVVTDLNDPDCRSIDAAINRHIAVVRKEGCD